MKFRYTLRLTVLLFMILVVNSVYSQQFTKEDEYKQVMENAKVAFDAKRYSEAVMFYKQAQKLNPKSNLPRYRIEDIRTIYIKREFEKQPETAVVKKEKRLSKKELVAKKEAEEKIREEATRKMNEDAEKARKAIEELKVEALELNIVEDDIAVEESEVEDAERNVETVSPEMSSKEIAFNVNSESVIDVEKRELPVYKEKKVAKTLDIDTVEYEVEEIEVDNPEKTIVAEKPKKEVKPIAKKTEEQKRKPLSEMTSEEKEVFIEVENKRLAAKYPDTKTIEELDKPGKHITRVIMNTSGKVTVYLKVSHSWGAVYFFMDKPGYEMQSINEVYFNRMTNLKTYGH